MIIENFAALSAQEQIDFATNIMKTINSEKIFSADTQFEITNVEAEDMTGSLVIEAAVTNPFEVSRKATWTCESEEDAEADPGFEASYDNALFEDAKAVFPATAVIDDYTITLEIADVEEVGDEAVEVEVDRVSREDSGIGSYEYFGFEGNDSQPYVEVYGTIVSSCDGAFVFYVEPKDM
jgi:hypothetical protein